MEVKVIPWFRFPGFVIGFTIRRSADCDTFRLFFFLLLFLPLFRGIRVAATADTITNHPESGGQHNKPLLYQSDPMHIIYAYIYIYRMYTTVYTVFLVTFRPVFCNLCTDVATSFFFFFFCVCNYLEAVGADVHDSSHLSSFLSFLLLLLAESRLRFSSLFVVVGSCVLCSLSSVSICILLNVSVCLRWGEQACVCDRRHRSVSLWRMKCCWHFSADRI